MDQDERPGFLDTLVALVARAMTALGLNGNRLLWKWRQRKQRFAEARVRTEVMLRSAKGRHKMCRSCRALVPRGATTCPECGESLAGVSTPGVTRLMTNLLPSRGLAVGLLLLVNGLMYILTMMSPVPDEAGGGEGMSLMSIPFYNLIRYGGGSGLLLFQHGEWWRLITPMFLHGGLLHFGMNTFVLLRLGPVVEELYGSQRFWCLYLGSGIAGNLAVALYDQNQWVVGASTSIVGMFGVLLAYGVRTGGASGSRIRSAMLQNALFILLFSLLPGISLVGHAGGFAGGFLLGLAIPAEGRAAQRNESAWQFLALAGVALALLAFYQVSVHGADFMRFL